MTTITQAGNKVLREKAKEVPVKDITKKRIQTVLKNMKKSLAGEDDGVALAAPQIGESLRIFVVSGKIFDKRFVRKEGIPKGATPDHSDVVFINPVFVKKSKKKAWMAEGCLSVRPLYGEVERSTNATVEAYDEHGVKFTRGGGGLLAQIFQHEIDHLDGTLFIDKARNIHAGNPGKE